MESDVLVGEEVEGRPLDREEVGRVYYIPCITILKTNIGEQSVLDHHHE